MLASKHVMQLLSEVGALDGCGVFGHGYSTKLAKTGHGHITLATSLELAMYPLHIWLSTST